MYISYNYCLLTHCVSACCEQAPAFSVHAENKEKSYFRVILEVKFGLFLVLTIKCLKTPMNCLVLFKHGSKLPMLLVMQYPFEGELT